MEVTGGCGKVGRSSHEGYDDGYNGNVPPDADGSHKIEEPYASGWDKGWDDSPKNPKNQDDDDD